MSDVLILVMSYLLRDVTYLYATILLFSSVCTFELKTSANVKIGTLGAVLECFAFVRFSPSNLVLAIHELDETHIGCFSFRTRDSFLQVFAAVVYAQHANNGIS